MLHSFFGIKLTLPNGGYCLIGHARLVAFLNGSKLVIRATATEVDEPGAFLEDFVEVGLLNGRNGASTGGIVEALGVASFGWVQTALKG